jgi:hypothetical protein
MIDDFGDTDEKLERLARATSRVEASADFHGRVMAAVWLSTKRDWRVGVWRLGRYGLAIAAVAVTLATVWAVRGASQDDELAATAYGTVDLEW